MKVIYTFCCFFFMLYTTCATAQTSKAQTEAAWKAKISAVYNDAFFEHQPQLYAFFKRLLTRRISYKRVDDAVVRAQYPTVQAQGLKRTVTEVAPPPQTIADLADFNPLAYVLEFDAGTPRVYAIEDSPFLLYILPQ